MSNFTDEIKAIPEDLASFTKGDVKLGNTKIPKIAIALIAVGIVAFLALKSSSTGQKSTSSVPTDNTSDGNGDSALTPLPVNETPLSGIGGVSSGGYTDGNSGLIPLGNDGGFLFGGGSAFNDLGVPNLSGNSQVISPDLGLSPIPYFGSSSYDTGYLGDILPQQPQAPLQNIVASSSGLVNANKQVTNPLQKALGTQLNKQQVSNPLQSALGQQFTKQPTSLAIPKPVVQQFKPVSTVVSTFSNLAKNLVSVITPKPAVKPVITVPKVNTPVSLPKPSASVIPASSLSKVSTIPKPLPVTGIKTKTVVLKN